MPLFHGKPTCECGAESLPLVEKVMLRKGLIKYNLDIYQLIGNATASGGVHRAGLVVDSGQDSPEQLRVWRDMGYDASWKRTVAQGFDIEHHHGAARGCPHNVYADYQIAAVDAGYNGLGTNGHGGRDNGPRPLSGRTWQEGVAWAKDLLAHIPAAPQPLTLKVANWNVASPKYFTAWGPRKDGIGMVLSGIRPDILVTEETHFSYMTTDILAALGGDYAHVSSPVGTDLFYRQDKLSRVTTSTGADSFHEYVLGPQGRAVNVLHLRDRATGKRVAGIGMHAPALVPTYRTIYGRRAANLISVVEDTRIVFGDFNTSLYSRAPRSNLKGIGFSFEREQADIVNEGAEEFPGKGWLGGIATAPKQAKIVSGQLQLTSPKLSDHRPIVARVVIP